WDARLPLSSINDIATSADAIVYVSTTRVWANANERHHPFPISPARAIAPYIAVDLELCHSLVDVTNTFKNWQC
ncbi:hypothetical protein Ae201684_013200, partial [Aphanomyces euteiches]